MRQEESAKFIATNRANLAAAKKGVASAVNAAEEILAPALAGGHGHLPALICDDRSLSFSELDALSNRFGNVLKSRGVARGDRVLFALADTPELVAGYLGAIKIGAVPAALSTRLSARELGQLIADSGPRALALQRTALPRLGEIDPRSLPSFVALAGDGGDDGAPWPDIAKLAAAAPMALDIADMAADDTALLVYTSGTTGAPKAAEHRLVAVLELPQALLRLLARRDVQGDAVPEPGRA